MSSVRQKVLSIGYQTGLINQTRHLWGAKRLTVLAYHRITEYAQPEFDLFVPNVSATPAIFAEHMQFVEKHFNVISMRDMHNWLTEKRPLPKNPLLITFDDGYRDNLEFAFPILQQYGFPATIFLATNYIGNNKPFFWDLIAYCFHHTAKTNVDLPLMGQQTWTTKAERTRVMNRWLSKLKTIPNAEKDTAVQQLPTQLEVTVPENAFDNICLTWDEVRLMAKSGITFGGHTQNHPILTRLSIEEAHTEIAGSQARIKAELDGDVTSFAYPNGQSTDFNQELMDSLRSCGYSMAFTLVPGPTKPQEVFDNPYAIRRIFIGNRDTLPRFAAKVMGLTRLQTIRP